MPGHVLLLPTVAVPTGYHPAGLHLIPEFYHCPCRSLARGHDLPH